MTSNIRYYSPIHAIAKQSGATFAMVDDRSLVQRFISVEAERDATQQSVALCDQSQRGKIQVEGQTAGQMLQADELSIGQGKVGAGGHIYRLRRVLFFVSTKDCFSNR